MKNKTKKKLIKSLKTIILLFFLINIMQMVLGIGISVTHAEAGATAFHFGTMAAMVLPRGLPLIFINILKLLIIVVGLILQSILSGAYSALATGVSWVGIEDIIFTSSNYGAKFLDVNFFSLTGLSETSNEYIFRTAIAKWYYILRLISLVILLVILIYIGIRMALTTVASEEAKYKKMIVSWVQSIALLFLLHYIVIFVININDSIVTALTSLIPKPVTVSGLTLSTSENMMDALKGSMWDIGLVGIFASFIYLVYVGQVFTFFVLYIKRMVTVGFLIMIAPLISITYSIDKIGDNKAQAFNAWLKEIIYNILIQPFHCIIYLTFFNAIANMINADRFNIAAYIIALFVMRFMKNAEDILKKIFHFEASSMSSIGEAYQGVMNARGKFADIGTKAAVGAIAFKQMGGIKAAKEGIQSFKDNQAAKKQFKNDYLNNAKSDSGNGLKNEYKSFREYKTSAEGQRNLEKYKQQNKEKTAAKMKAQEDAKRAKKEEKVKKRYEKENGAGSYEKFIKKEKDKALQEAYDDQINSEFEPYRENALKKEYDRRCGYGAYDKLKTKADKGDVNAQRTLDDLKKRDDMKQVMAKGENEYRKTSEYKNGLKNFKKTDEANEIAHNSERATKKRIKENYSTVPVKAINGVKKFSEENEYGKAVRKTLDFATQYSLPIAFAGLAGTGDLADMVSAWQIGAGVTKGIKENSRKTITQENADAAAKLCEVMHADTDNAGVLAQTAYYESLNGLLDPKVLTEQFEKFSDKVIDAIKNSGGSDIEQQRAISDIMSKIQERIMSDEYKGKSINIKEIVEEATNKYSIDTTVQKEIITEAERYTTLSLKSSIAARAKVGAGSNYTIEEQKADIQTSVNKNFVI